MAIPSVIEKACTLLEYNYVGVDLFTVGKDSTENLYDLWLASLADTRYVLHYQVCYD